MYNDLTDIAIKLALKCNWNEAIKTNKQILLENPTDIDAINRLAKAYFESGNVKKAKNTSLQAIKIDSSDKIAEKALEKYKRSKPIQNKVNQSINVSDFIEETGKTKQTNLINICSIATIATLDTCDEVFLSTHAHRVTVVTSDNKYIGKLPDDLSAKIKDLSKKGYKYRALIKSASKQNIRVIVKEIKRGKGFENKQSFSHESLESVGEFGA